MLNNIKSYYNVKHILGLLKPRKMLIIMRHNKFLQKRVEINMNDYKEECFGELNKNFGVNIDDIHIKEFRHVNKNPIYIGKIDEAKEFRHINKNIKNKELICLNKVPFKELKVLNLTVLLFY